MILYHFTSTFHLDFIRQSGVVKASESNVGSGSESMPPHGPRRGPDVVWLLDTPVLESGHGLRSSAMDKTAVCLTIEVDNAIQWRQWRHIQRMHPRWRRKLVTAGGGTAAADRWWVHVGDIPFDRVLEVHTRDEVSRWPL